MAKNDGGMGLMDQANSAQNVVAMAAALMRCTKALMGSLEVMQGIIREQVA